MRVATATCFPFYFTEIAVISELWSNISEFSYFEKISWILNVLSHDPENKVFSIGENVRHEFGPVCDDIVCKRVEVYIFHT